MRSVADDLRDDQAREIAALPLGERIALALRLGERDVALYRAAHGVTEAEARAVFARARAIGRRPSNSNDPP
jgi:hypothetical protein